MKKGPNIIGQRFGRLVVVSKVVVNNRPGWECLCDCTTTKVIHNWQNLKSGSIKSCGCLRAELRYEKAINRRLYHPKISKAREVYLAKYSDGDLTFDDFYCQSQQNCYYCNNPPSNIRKTITYKKPSQFYKENAIFIYNGLDRVDNDLPHNKANCVPCCKECNFSKRNLTLQEFNNLIKNINYNKHKKIPNYELLFSKVDLNKLCKFKRINGQLNQAYKDIKFDKNLFYFILTLECFYCNKSNVNRSKCKNGDIIEYNGLDRIDQTKPHYLNNIVPCCKHCNWSKGKRSQEQFIKWAERIYYFNERKNSICFLFGL